LNVQKVQEEGNPRSQYDHQASTGDEDGFETHDTSGN